MLSSLPDEIFHAPPPVETPICLVDLIISPKRARRTRAGRLGRVSYRVSWESRGAMAVDNAQTNTPGNALSTRVGRIPAARVSLGRPIDIGTDGVCACNVVKEQKGTKQKKVKIRSYTWNVVFIITYLSSSNVHFFFYHARTFILLSSSFPINNSWVTGRWAPERCDGRASGRRRAVVYIIIVQKYRIVLATEAV